MKKKEITIVAMGNSLTEGYGVDINESYPSLLENMLRKNGHSHRVVNSGISGETSSAALSRIHWIIEQLNPDLIILETGANDGLRGIDPSILYRNLTVIIQVLEEHHIGTILAGMKMLPSLGESYRQTFEKVYTDVARETGVPFIPFFLKDVAGNPILNLPDRIHPNSKGYKIVVETVYPYVIKAVDDIIAKKKLEQKGK